MSEKRYIVASRRRPGLPTEAVREVERAVEADTRGAMLRSTPTGRRVVTLTDEVAGTLARSRPDLIVEEDRPLEHYGMPELPAIVPASLETGAAIPVRVTAPTGAPIADCTIFGRAGQVGYRADTGEDGTAVLAVGPEGVESLIVSPRDSFWSRVVEPVEPGADGVVHVTLQPLDVARATAWVRGLLGLSFAPHGLTGRGVSVAVVDSGLSRHHPGLVAAGGYNTLDGQNPDAWDVDDGGHGTHCAGLVACRTGPDPGAGVRGAAPAVSLYSLKVFPGGFVSDLVEAVEWCTMQRIDLVNLSLGSPEPSAVLGAALQDADARGVTAIAATGNAGTHVAYPAAFPTVMGVGAIGRLGSFPADSGHALRVGRYRDWWGGLFNASFTNFGNEVDVCAPGVAILSTVPTGHAAWDGTSMACPLVTGLAALVLEACPFLRTGDSAQPEAVRQILRAAAVDLGLPPFIQGRGLPTLPRILATVQQLWG